jgi:hypothetical protein
VADHLLSLDLGKMNDYSALALIRRSLMITPDGLPVRDHRRQTLYKFEVINLKRWPKFTPYPEVISFIKDRVLLLSQIQPSPRLILDASGVGNAVVDMVLDANMGVTTIPVTITGGTAVSWKRWPRSRAIGCWSAKEAIVSHTQYALQSKRLVIWPIPPDQETGLDTVAILKDELKGFTVKMTRAAHEVYTAREGAHDDVLLAVALGVFVGMQPRLRYDTTAPVPIENAAFGTEIANEESARKLATERDAQAAREALMRADEARRLNPLDPSWGWTNGWG